MSIDPVEHLDDTSRQAAERLRHITHNRLRRIRASGIEAVAGPSLIVTGYHDSTSEIIAHGFDPTHDAIFGLTLAPRFDAIAAFARSVVATADGRHRDGWCSIAVDRTGVSSSFIAIDGRDPCETAAPSGWLVDACKRAVGLGTSSRAEDPLHLLLALWLDRLLVELISSAGYLGWSDAVALAPVPPTAQAHDPMTVGTAIAARTQPWDDLRGDVACGRRLAVPIEPDHAAWMDTPMFARWCLGFFPDVSDLRNDIGFLASTDLAASVETAIRSAIAASTAS